MATEGKTAEGNASEFATLADLCGEEVERDQAEKALPRYGGKLIRYRTRIPLQRLLHAQAKFMGGKRKDTEGFILSLLQYLLLVPKVATKAEVEMLKQADGKVMLEIINEAVGNVADVQEEAEAEVGE